MMNLKTKNLVFPLCLLSYQGEENKYTLIRRYAIVRWAKLICGKLGNEEINEYEDKIADYIDEQTNEIQKQEEDKNSLEENEELRMVEYYENGRLMELNEELNEEDYNNETSGIGYNDSNLHKCIIIACYELGISIKDINAIMNDYKKAQNFIDTYEGKYGNDALVKLHKSLLFEVENKKFNESYFKIYCAIISLIGKKKYRKITVNEIRYRMNGYKKKEIFEIEKETNKNIEILTDSQITTITKKLKKCNFLDRETVKRRFTYYSKKLRGEKFRKVLIEDLAKRKFAKEKAKIDSLNIDMLIDKEVKNKLQAEYESIKMNDKEKIIFQN